MTHKPGAAVLCGVLVLLVLAVALWGFSVNLVRDLYNKFLSPSVDQEIAQNVVIPANDWFTIKSSERIASQRQIQEILFEFEKPEPDFDLSRPLPQVQAKAPTLELIDENGNSFQFRFGGASNTALLYRPSSALPTDRSYVSIRIKSQMELHLKRIAWHCYNSWDRK